MIDTTVVVRSVPIMVSAVTRDYFDVAALVASLAVAPLAGLFGAWIGGRQARKASLEAVQLQLKAERDKAVKRVKIRLELILITVTAGVHYLLKYDDTVPFLPPELDFITRACDQYDQLAHDLVQLDDDAFMFRVHDLMTIVRVRVAKLTFVDATFIKESEAGTISMEQIQNTRHALVDPLAPFADQAEALRSELREKQ
jgi:hypothetical protein